MDVGRSQGAWFAIQVRPKCEHSVSICLRNKWYHDQTTWPSRPGQDTFDARERPIQYEESLPLARPLKQALKTMGEASAKPLYPEYLFCRFDSGRIVTTPCVIRRLDFDRTSVGIDDRESASMPRVSEVWALGAPMPRFSRQLLLS